MIQAIDFIIMQNRIYTPSGASYRRISEVVEVVGMEGDTIQLNKIFKWNPEKDTIENVSITSRTLANIAEISGNSLSDLYHEIDNRQIVLEHMVRQNIRSVSAVKHAIEQYYKNPKRS